MRRRTVLGFLAAAPAIVGVTRNASAQDLPPLTYAYVFDPLYDVFFWAIKKGIVKSTEISLQTKGLTVPELIQATSTKQYDVVQTAVIAIPPAVARGLELRIVSNAMQYGPLGLGNGMYVRKDSPLQSAAELKGKVLGTYGLRSTGFLVNRLALIKKYGLNAAIEGGDVKMVEIPLASLPAALATHQIDAATLVYSQAYIAEQSGDFRVLAEAAQECNEAFGFRFVTSVNVTYPEKLAAYPNRFQEFLRLLRESLNYALSHREEVFGDVAKAYNLSPAYFTWLFDKVYDVTPTVTMGQQKAIQDLWSIAKDQGIIPAVPDIAPLVWEKVARS